MISKRDRYSYHYLSSMVTMLLVLLLPAITQAQEEDECPEPSKKALKLYESAIAYNLKGVEAYEKLIKAIEIDPNYAAAYSALAYINAERAEKALALSSVASLNNLRKAENLVEKYWKLAIEHCPSYRNWESHFLLGQFYYARQRYDEAFPHLQTYVANTVTQGNSDFRRANEYLKELNASVKQEKRSVQIRDSLLANKVPFDPVKIARASTPSDEYLPVLSPDNRYLFFTRREWVDTRTIHGKEEQERFIRSLNNYDNSFTVGEPMPAPFNQGLYQGGVSLSVDNKLMFVTVVSLSPQRDGTLFANGDIYYSELKESGWTPLASIGPHINQPATWEGQPSLSADNNTLYFASARPPDGEQNYGGMDLYKTIRLENGGWSEPINLGPVINTPGNEKTPFLHSDSYTLYFASDQHPGIGGFDIFYARMDEKGQFQTPENLGYPINTENDEHGFVVSTDGRHGYFSSNLDGSSLDIYSFDMPKKARPEQVVFVRGQVVSGKEAAKGLEILLKNTETNKEVNAVIDEESGEYVGVIAVKEGEDAIMTAKKEGYAFSSQYISSTDNVVGKPIETELEVREIEVGETYKINNINFATDSYELNKTAKVVLNEFFEFLKTNKGVKVSIQGHTDNEGNAEDNMVLSANRARSVYDYLIEKGIDASRLTHKGFGQTQPVATNDTEEGRAKNRRTEFVILSK